MTDLSGNPLGSNVVWTFLTAPATGNQTDTTVADFGTGTVGPNACVAQAADGEVILNPTLGTEFNGLALPGGWSSTTWSNGGFASVGSGRLTVDGAIAATTTAYGPGRSLEFMGTFNPAPFQHIGLAADMAFNAPWALFSTGNSSNYLYARTSDGLNVFLPGVCLGTPYRFRIDWMTNVVFSIDGIPVATNSATIAGSLRPIVSDFSVGGPGLSVDWLRLTPYASSETFTSRILDAGQAVTWQSLTWTADTPVGTTLSLSYRFGNTPALDGSWSSFTPVAASGAALAGNSRYFQYRAQLATSQANQTPALKDVTVACSFRPTVVTPAISWANPADIMYGTPLSATQLNATASVPGTFTYSPPAGTILNPGANQLSVSFVPNDTVNYTNASAAVAINVRALSLGIPSYSPSQGLQFTVTGTPGSTYVVEASTNLVNWLPLKTNSSPFTFTDPNAVALPLRFYRAHQWP